MTIAVDFDGTIVEDKYPQIGKERPFAVATLKQLMMVVIKTLLMIKLAMVLLNGLIGVAKKVYLILLFLRINLLVI